ncbi:hypothetical protein [Paenibacillus sp. UMB4589-SE434]|uniref:hypothetical protein n=1 Tax=Paenibacillus sp. UMB4589-SE434 TaxID=3046314 RepID=UPI00254AA728|nr:hypothetical protein [Paenibacillus sp. UMB4589-SE434]MDK8179408.1 hypothetical protein [Paenibacillus sp. UMB4589-SE434]
MAKPIISWYNETHSAQVNAPVDFGIIDAGDWGPVYTFNIWNNRNQAIDVPLIKNCRITTRDMKGGTGDTVGNEVEVVKNNWFHAQVNSLGETDLKDPSSLIGKDYEKPIGTKGVTTKDYTGKAYPSPIVPAAGDILGVNNNGDPVDAAGNYVTVALQAEVPLNASAGRQDFRFRVSYSFS